MPLPQEPPPQENQPGTTGAEGGAEGQQGYSESQRPTEDEFDDKVNFVYDCLVKCMRTSEIKKKFRSKFRKDYGKGKEVNARTIQAYISRARKLLAHHADLTIEQEKAASLAYWRARISDPKSTNTEKDKARVRIEKIMGVEAAKKIAPTTPDGQPLSFASAMATIEALAAGKKES